MKIPQANFLELDIDSLHVIGGKGPLMISVAKKQKQ